MDAVYRLGKVTAAEVRAQLPDPPGYSAVRATLRIRKTRVICGIPKTALATSIQRRFRRAA